MTLDELRSDLVAWKCSWDHWKTPPKCLESRSLWLKFMETSKSRGDENKLRVIWSFSFTYRQLSRIFADAFPQSLTDLRKELRSWELEDKLRAGESCFFERLYTPKRSVLLRSKPAMLRSVRSRHLLPWCWWWWCQCTCYQSSKRRGLVSKKCFLGCLLAVGETNSFQDWNVYFFASVIGASPFGNPQCWGVVVVVVVKRGWTQAVGVRALTSALPKRLRPRT